MPEPVRGFAVMCDVFDRSDVSDDDRFKTPVDRFKNMAPLMEIFEAEFAQVTSSWVIDAIGARGSVCALVMTTDEVVKDPQTIAAGVLRTVDHPDGQIQVVDAPFSVHDGHAGTPDVLSSFGEIGADNNFLREFLR